MNKALIFCLIVALAASTEIPSWVYDSFDSWCNKFEKTYDSPSERNYRVGIFYTNLQHINKENAAQKSYKLAMNQFTDLTTSEFLEMYTGFKPKATKTMNYVTLPTANLPTTVNWVTAGAVTAIKNQGQCGDCWAFSTTGSLEGIYEINTKNLTSFSEQQLTDCSDSYGNEGCNGGLMDDAFEYVEKQGIQSEASYPFVGVDTKCTYNKADVVFTITGYTNVPASNNDALQAAVAQQPISIAIDAEAIMSYSSGIFDNKNCGTSLDHGVLAVGYGEEDSTDYWLVKNSWGTSWGMSGYIKFVRATGSGTAICGLNLMASYPTWTQ